MKKHYIAWWNLENLFDVQNSILRPDWLKKKLAKELKGWTEAILDKKIANLASVIMQMNQGKGPDLLGVCEVENEQVMEKLADALKPLNRKYILKHHDTKDQRGIDIAFLADEEVYDVEKTIFTYEVLKRAATRDMLQINLKTNKGTELIVIGNHWPARSGGQYQNEPYRMMCGETLSYWLSRIVEIKGSKIPILVMGDFNDEPFNRSLSEYCMSSSSLTKVNRGQLPYLYNLTQQLNVNDQCTYVFNNDRLLIDQMMVSKGISLTSEKFDLKRSELSCFRLPGMTKGLYHTPIRFGRPSSASSFNQDGYSDHLPLVLDLHER